MELPRIRASGPVSVTIGTIIALGEVDLLLLSGDDSPTGPSAWLKMRGPLPPSRRNSSSVCARMTGAPQSRILWTQTRRRPSGKTKMAAYSLRTLARPHCARSAMIAVR